MQPRIKNPALSLPGAFDAHQAVHKSIENADLPRTTLELTNLRASQINGCSVCVDMHSRALRKLGEKVERIFAVSSWREAPYYSDAERAALALAEAATRLSDRADPVPDEVWKEAARHPLALSEAFARAAEIDDAIDLGEHALKGVKAKVRVFTLRSGGREGA
jgi:AhpD family alkylhydroperoxidase